MEAKYAICAIFLAGFAFLTLTQGCLMPIAEVDGKKYFADRNSIRNWTASGDFCRSQGLKLASITSRREWKALDEAYSIETFYGGYWTSGRDSLELSEFRWNETASPIPSAYTTYVGSSVAIMNCLYYSSRSGTNTSTLTGYVCTERLGTLCESLDS